MAHLVASTLLPMYVQPTTVVPATVSHVASRGAGVDNAARHLGDRPDSPCGGFDETPVAQLPSGRIVALSRPHASPFMWQTHSDDGGKTWQRQIYALDWGQAGRTSSVVQKDDRILTLIAGTEDGTRSGPPLAPEAILSPAASASSSSRVTTTNRPPPCNHRR